MSQREAELYDEARDARAYAAFLENVIRWAVAEIDRADTQSQMPWLAVLRARERLAEAIGAKDPTR